MAIKYKNTILAGIMIGAFLFIEANCSKLPIDCANTKYSFELPVKSYPDKDSIHVGDTIWLEINESILFRDANTNQLINFGGSKNIGSAIGFQKFNDSIKNWLPSIIDFTFTLLEGTISNSSDTTLFKEYLFKERNDRYLFKLFIIPKSKGLFRLVFSNSNNTYTETDKCTKASFVINFTETNHNRHLVGYTGSNVPGGDLNFYVK